MIAILRGFIKSIPTLILSLFLAVAVWVSAVNAADPVVQRAYPRAVTIDRVGLPTDLVLSGEIPTQVMITMSAPQTVWEQLNNDRNSVRAFINLAGLGPGTHTVEVRVESTAQPVKVVNKSPQFVNVTLERLVTEEFPITLDRRGEPAVGFQVDPYQISGETVTISGPASRVASVQEARVTLDISQASDTINRRLDVLPLDVNEALVEDVTVNPAEVTISQPISQRGGYRVVAVRVVVAGQGQVASGYRLTSITAFPSTVTVFSSNPALIERLPGFVETSPLDLTGAQEDIEVHLPLNLPDGVQVDGDQTVLVQASVAAIEGSVTLSGLPVEIVGLPEEFAARISPRSVDVIVSGPLSMLDRLTESDVLVFLDLSQVEAGTYQFAPRVTLGLPQLRMEAILPSSLEVVVELKSEQTPTVTPSPTSTATATPRVVLTPVP